MLSKIVEIDNRPFRSNGRINENDLLEAASTGADFLREHAIADNGHVYFGLAPDGEPRLA